MNIIAGEGYIIREKPAIVYSRSQELFSQHDADFRQLVPQIDYKQMNKSDSYWFSMNRESHHTNAISPKPTDTHRQRAAVLPPPGAFHDH